VKSSGFNHFAATCLLRVVERFAQASILPTLFSFLLVALPVLLVASPQRIREGSGRLVAAAEAEDRQMLAANFPELPYQGTPPELPQDQ
jgi:hypothetical protein